MYVTDNIPLKLAMSCLGITKSDILSLAAIIPNLMEDGHEPTVRFTDVAYFVYQMRNYRRDGESDAQVISRVRGLHHGVESEHRESMLYAYAEFDKVFFLHTGERLNNLKFYLGYIEKSKVRPPRHTTVASVNDSNAFRFRPIDYLYSASPKVLEMVWKEADQNRRMHRPTLPSTVLRILIENGAPGTFESAVGRFGLSPQTATTRFTKALGENTVTRDGHTLSYISRDKTWFKDERSRPVPCILIDNHNARTREVPGEESHSGPMTGTTRRIEPLTNLTDAAIDAKRPQNTGLIAEARQTLSLSITEAAERAGITAVTWSGYERRLIRQPNKACVRKIAKFLKIPYLEVWRFVKRTTP